MSPEEYSGGEMNVSRFSHSLSLSLSLCLSLSLSQYGFLINFLFLIWSSLSNIIPSPRTGTYVHIPYVPPRTPLVSFRTRDEWL